MGPTGKYRIFQIHPTRRCNLRCLHCYSSSGPEVAAQLPPATLRSALRAARAEGYTVAGFSGGEPLIYAPLGEVLAEARELGFFITVTSNGMLLDRRRLETLAGRVDLLAISLDGEPASHDRMRGSDRAFATMARRLEGVRESGIPFGFIFTLTQHNLHELPWVASFALSQGAALLQIHPLELNGRAAETLGGARPDAIETAWAYVATEKVRAAVGDRLQVQLDLVDLRAARRAPERLFAEPAGNGLPAADGRPLGELLSPLVLETDGALVPLHYGFPRRWSLGDLSHEPFADCAERWRRELDAGFRALCRRVYADLDDESEGDLPITNWYDRIAAAAAADAAEAETEAEAETGSGAASGAGLVTIGDRAPLALATA